MTKKTYKSSSFIQEPKDKQITSSDEVASILRELIGKDISKKEFFCLITLTGASRIIEKRIIHIGTLNQSLVHPREILHPALLDNAAAIIIGHNHPSGTLEASRSDISTTQRIQEVAKLVGIELIDHIIFTELGFLSFSDMEFL